MSVFRISAFVMGALLLAACGDSEPLAPQSPTTRTKGVAPAAEPPFAGADWSRITSGEGVALRLEEEGDLIAAVACIRAPARLRVESDRFQPIMSEDRFTIGAGDEAYALAANLEAVRERGVEASGDIPADLLGRIEAGGEIAFNYGAQNLGPFPAVPETDRAAFVAECREIAG
ncbi:MAG: hypothetical protein ACK4FB_07005 [Brevundimonas sp.]|uniref:hypothetical protein n=1 Tax=Brevundimonas sp. TaxID=1871086 RepID=UPI00391B412A